MARRLREYPDIVLDLDVLGEPADFTRIFGRPEPLHIEVGSGKGTFLASQAQAQTDVNFLGIEWARKYYRYAVDRIGRWGLDNVRLVRADAADFITRFVPDSSVACYHIYYPDPWPKKRHHKRRFICPVNVEQLLRTLSLQGKIRIATDQAEYFEWMKEVFVEFVDRLKKVEFTPAAGAEGGEIIGTNYERKYIKENRDVFTLAFEKKE
ncbi:MAG: tRNA (guanosine(46)-N7)-methyltransferase TrmB [Sedimentisphaerales bacterium]|nr:tRNA (guanosine(46)-N7)-methyltransferase TrmB [Sedimentisphaerales bacterium]